MRNYVKPVLAFLCISLGVGSCICGDLERDSGLDPANDTRVDGTPVAGDSTFAVTLVDDYASAFRYRLDDGVWQETDGSTITVDYAASGLDEGEHTLTVVMVNTDGVEDDSPETFTFTVDLVTATSLLVTPRLQEAATGAYVAVGVALEEMEEDYLNGAAFTLAYDPSLITVDSVSYGTYLGNVTLERCDTDSAAGRTEISFITGLLAWDSVTGGGTLVDVHCTALNAGTAALTLTGALLKTAANPATDSVSARVPAVRGGRIDVH